MRNVPSDISLKLQSDQILHCPSGINFAALAIKNAASENSDLTAQMCRLICIFTVHLHLHCASASSLRRQVRSYMYFY